MPPFTNGIVDPAWRGRPAPFWLALLLVASGIYYLGFALWYSGTALGLSPALDGKEMLQLARAIAAGELGSEPFYRAPLYPALLAPLAGLGLADAELALAARLLNGLAHLLATALVFRLAQRLWKTVPAGLIAGGLWAFHPVAFHFAVDPLDTALGIGLLLLALWSALRTLDAFFDGEPGILRRAAWTGLWLGLAVVARPHALPVAVVWPVALLAVVWARSRDWRKAWWPSLASTGGLALPLLLLGAVNVAVSGTFALLPSQGAFNLYAANREGAHGRYHVQQVAMWGLPEHQNPTRYEAGVLYDREPEHDPQATVAERNAYWRQRFWERVGDDPMGWIGQLLGKAVALLHPYEQYNNKTYALHRERSPWLRWNPLGWAPIALLAVPGVVLAQRRREGVWLLGTGLAYAGGVLLFYVSARFRLPLVPLLCVAAGWWAAPHVPTACGHLARSLGHSWRRGQKPCLALSDEDPIRRRCFEFFGVVALVNLLLLVWLAASYDQDETAAQDYLLMAQASAELGRDDDALGLANAALALEPQLDAALELRVVAQFNFWLTAITKAGPAPSDSLIHEQRSLLNELAARGYEQANLRFIDAVYAYRLGHHEAALASFNELATANPPHQGARLAVDLDRQKGPLANQATPLTLALWWLMQGR